MTARASLLFGALLVLSASEARAHHGPAGAATPFDNAAFVDPVAGNLGAVRTRVGLFTRYLRLSRIPPTYTNPVPQAPSHLVFNDLRATVAFLERLAVSAALPVVVNVPDAADAAAGLGDLRFGVQGVPWRTDDGRHAITVGYELALPTGDVLRGLGAGVTVSRASTLYLLRLAPAWMMTAELGAVWAFEGDTNVVVDYGGGLRWSPLEALGLFFDLRAGTYTQTRDTRLSALQRQPRAAGDTAVTLTPGIVVQPFRQFHVALAPQIPLSNVKDFDVGVTLSAQYGFSL